MALAAVTAMLTLLAARRSSSYGYFHHIIAGEAALFRHSTAAPPWLSHMLCRGAGSVMPADASVVYGAGVERQARASEPLFFAAQQAAASEAAHYAGVISLRSRCHMPHYARCRIITLPLCAPQHAITSSPRLPTRHCRFNITVTPRRAV